MRFEGEWFECEDGVTRPTIRASMHGAAVLVEWERFLIDTGADRAVLHADFLQRLRLTADPPPSNSGLAGIGGIAGFVVVRTALELRGQAGRPAIFRGEFAAFTNPRGSRIEHPRPRRARPVPSGRQPSR